MINVVLIEHIKHISEVKPRFQKIKEISSNWKAVCVVAVLALTLKAMAEQVALLIIR
jgi:hypothetical protein